MARNTSIACKSLLSIRRRISGTDVVPRCASRPPRPLMSFCNSSRVYSPEKQRSISGPGGSVPARSGENGPAPLRALEVSITRPWRCALTVMPPPMCETIRFSSSYFRPVSRAYRRAMAFWLRARQLGQSRNACVGNHLVHHDRIGDIGLDTDLGCDLLCDQSAQIRGVLPPGVEQVVVQCVVHLVDPALDGMNQPAAADDGRESADVKSAFAQRFEHEVFPPFELVADRRERGDLGGGVVDRQRKDGLRIFVDGDLRGGRARVNSQNDVAHGRDAYCRFGRGFQCVSGQPGRPARWSTSWSGASRRAR